MTDPYRAFQRLRSGMAVSALTIVFAGTRYIRDWFPQAISIDIRGLILWAYIIAPLLIWLLVASVIFPSMLERKYFRMLVLGSRYIEGDWIEYWQTSTRSGFSIVSIEPDKESFSLSGKIYSVDGVFEMVFVKSFHEFKRPNLHYCYVNTPRPDDANNVEGIAVHAFSLQRRARKEYVGYASNSGAKERFAIRAKKLTRKEARLLGTEQGVVSLIDQYKPIFISQSIQG